MRNVLFALFAFPCFLHAQFPDPSLVPDSLVSIWQEAGIDSSLIPVEAIFNAHDYINFTNLSGEFHVSSDSFMQAISMLPLNGQRVLFFPEGVYEFTITASNGGISLPGNFILRGEGADKTLFKLVAENDSSVSFFNIHAVNTGIEFLKIDASEMFSASFSQDQNEVEILTANRNIISFSNASNSWLYGVECYMGLGSTVLINQSDHIWIHGCYFNDAWLHGNHLNYGTQGYGVAFGGSATSFSSYCLIENNIFERFRHAINLQYFAKHNVIAYNYTKASRSYNFLAGLAFNSPTADFVLHGNGPSENLIEGNVFAGGGLANGLNIDKVKVIPNGPRNVVYRNFSFRGLVLQKNACDYNKHQILLANQSASYLIDGEGHFMHCNIDTFGVLAQRVGVDCALNINNANLCESEKLGVSAYLTSKPCWMNTMQLPHIGILGSGSYSNAAFKRYASASPTLLNKACPEITRISTLSIDKIEVYPNPFTSILTLDLGSNEEAEIVVFDVLGQEIFKANQVKGEINMNTINWSKGIYFLSLSIGNQTFTQLKVLKK